MKNEKRLGCLIWMATLLCCISGTQGRTVREALDVLLATEYCGEVMMDGWDMSTAIRGESPISDDSVFDVPEEGFDSDEPLISVMHVNDDGTTAMQITGSFDRWRSGLRQSVDVTLIEATGETGTVGLSANAIAAANATLPDGCRIFKSADNKKLILHVGSLAGTMVIFR